VARHQDPGRHQFSGHSLAGMLMPPGAVLAVIVVAVVARAVVATD
jgi:hypothetical protein